jgi:hypothetical protein
LGVAVYKSLGIGLGFNFDHMNKLPENEVPTSRRLQARAAKSAVRRVQAIYDAPAAQEILDGIDDPIERDQKAAELRREADQEIQYLAKRLSELIPTDLALDNKRDTRIQQYDSSSYERTASNEYSQRHTSRTVQDLIKDSQEGAEDEVDYLNPSGKQADDNDHHNDDDDGSNRDEEFLDAWLKQSQKGNDDESDDNISTVLA